MEKGVKVALIVSLVTFLISQGDFRSTLIVGASAFGADLLLG